MTARVAVLAVAVWTCSSAAPQPLLVVALQRHFHAGCIHLLYVRTDLLVTRELVQQQVALAASGIPTAALSWEELSDAPGGVPCRRNRPLYVIMSWEQEAISRLQQLPSHPRWLLSLDTSDVTEALSGVAVPFDCEFLVAVPGHGPAVPLAEVYRANATRPLRAVPWGSWDPGQGVSGPALSLHQRRRDLEGVTVRVVMTNDTSFEVVKERKDKSLHIEGMFPSLWYSVQKKLNFTTEVRLVTVSRGSKLNAGPWSGIIGMLIRGEADVCINSFSMTSSRRTVVDYSVPLVITRTCVFIRTPEEHDNRWDLYLKPFSVGIWLSLAAAVLLIGTYLSWLYRMARYLGSDTSEGNDLHSCLHYVMGIICLQPPNTTPKSWSCRVVFWFSMFMAMVLITCYMAIVTAKMTLQKTHLPFGTLEGLLDDGTYMFGVTANTGLFTNFHSAKDNVMQEVYHRLIVPNIRDMPVTYLEGLQRVCKGKYAFMVVCDTAMGLMKHVQCPTSVLPNTVFPITLAMVLRKQQPYRRLLNHMFQKERRSGVMRRLFLLQWLRNLSEVEHKYKQVHLHDVSPPLSMWVAAVAVASTIFVVESALRRLLNLTRDAQRPRHLLLLPRREML